MLASHYATALVAYQKYPKKGHGSHFLKRLILLLKVK